MRGKKVQKLFLLKMNLSERVLGRRVVNYLSNEALVGRINSQKIKVSKNYLVYISATGYQSKPRRFFSGANIFKSNE